MATAQLSRQKQLEEIINVRGKVATSVKQKEETKAKDSRFASIEANPFFDAVLASSISPEEKTAAVAQLLTFAGTREENRERVKAFNVFKEYLQAERETMASQIIKMSDTKNFALMRDVYEEINNALIDFENDMKPFTDIIDALHKLRAENQTMDAFREIKDEAKRAEAVAARDKQLAEQIAQVEAKMSDLKTTNRIESQKKSFFGMGGLKRESIEVIARNEVALETARTEIEKLATQAQENLAKISNNNTSNVVDQDAKEKLKEMLNLSSGQHQERSEKLIKSAMDFVTTSKDKIATIREHLERMGDQVQNLDDANGQMTFVYAILGEGTKSAEQKNREVRDEVAKVGENENMVQKLTRESKQKDLNEHIQMLEISSSDTTATVADLTSASIRIKNMNDANHQQIQMATNMQTRGVAGVADRLSTVIQAVGAAAIAESNAMTAQTLNAMSDATDVIAQKESMRIAMGITDVNHEMVRAIEGLAQYGEVNKAATEFTRAGIAEMRQNLEVMQQVAEEVASSVLEGKSLYAEDLSVEEKTKPTSKTGSSNPFNL